MSSGRAGYPGIFAVLAVLAGFLAWGTASRADHYDNDFDVGGICYSCHVLNPLLADPDPDTSFIRASTRTHDQMISLAGGATPNVFGCTFCHQDPTRTTHMKTAFGPFDSKASQHPVDRGYSKDSSSNVSIGANTYTTLYMSNWDNSWTRPSDQIGCVDCHRMDGAYPNHPRPDNVLRANNPFMLKNTAAMDNNHAPDSFCLATCHGRSASSPAEYKMGHLGRGAYDSTTGGMPDNTLKEPSGIALKTSKCADCHETHSTNVKPNLMGEQRQSVLNVDPANCTSLCHASTVFTAKGHGKAGVNLGCANCHDSSGSHRDPSNKKRLIGGEATTMASLTENLAANGRDDNYDGVIDDAGEANLAYSAESNCSGSCHSDKHIHKGTIGTSSRSSSCLHCHDMHGNNIDNNIRMVRGTIMGKQTIYQSTADFFRSDNTSERASVCDNPNCHSKPLGNTTAPGTILGDVQEHKDANVQVGTVCTSCHNHSSASDGDSFAPVCNSCHTYPGQAVLGGTHALSSVHTKHVASDNTGGYAFACSTCHYKYTHNQSGVNNGGEWGTKFQASYVNLKFDGLWNPPNTYGPRYAGVAADNTLADNVYAPGVGGTGVCAGLYCHGNSTTVASWPAGSNTTPSWNTPSTGACGTCHKVLANDPPSTYAHPKHADNTTVGYSISCSKCHYGTTTGGATIASRSAHLNRQSNVTFDTADALLSSGLYGGTTTVGDSGTTTGTCSNIYCHSPGSRTGPPFDNGILGFPDWKAAGPLACNACHGSLADASGTPAYATGSPKVNSHPRHIVMGYGCQACHVDTTSTGNTITGRASHVNAAYNVTPDNVAHDFATPYVSPDCSNIACHGNNAAAWGGTSPLCGQCHLSAADTDQYQTANPDWFGNDNAGTISSAEWSFSGHGKTSGTYVISGHNAADFPSGAGTGDPCTYCHDSTVAHRLATNPFRLKDQTGVSGYATAGWNATCLVCHSKTQTPPGYTPDGVPFSRNSVAGDRVDTAHYGTLHVGDNTLGGRLCWDCHDAHGDSPDINGNIYMIQKQTLSKTDGVYGYRGTGGTQTGAIVFANDNAPVSGGDWADNTSPYNGICNVCHTTAGHYRTASGDTHNRDKKCTDCHSHDKNFGASCNACHGEATGPGANGMPPYAPYSSHPWASAATVDNLSFLAGVGDHRTATGIASSSHGTFDCSECHTSSPGSDAGHDTGKTNASMTQISALHGWTGAPAPAAASWSAGSLAGAVSGGSVTDDSCSNINCHSPYYDSNAARSGTAFPYTRYWLNQTLWDCYTCHAYDGRTATSRPAGADNTMATGMHPTHVVARQYACSRCHDVTDYSATTWPNTNADHKNGFIDWSFAGSPNPYGTTPSYSLVTGTVAPTDDNASAAHRSWGNCSNLYCHSVGQTSAGAALTGAAGEYKTPAWDNALSGKCGTCHGGDGVTENPGNWIASGSHTQHVNASPYAFGCGVCHGGLGRGASTHADNGIDLSFGTVGSLSLAPTVYSQGNAHVAGNGFGNCTVNYCHGTGTPALTGGANQAGAPNVPAWGTASTSLCGSCHGGPGGSTNYAGKGSEYPASGAHARHLTDVIGPRITACADCHTVNTSASHVDGKVNLRTRFDNTTATTLALTQTCDPCHGSGVSTAKANWSTVASVDCLTCHGSTAAYSYADATGRVAPNMAGDNSTYGANAAGHNRPTGNGAYASGNPAGNRTCGECHDLAIAHIDGAEDNTTYAGNRLLDNVNSVTGITTVSGLCAACHTTALSSPATKKSVNTHGNAGYAGRLEASFTGLECGQCHEPHGMVNVSTGATGVNLWMISPTITVTAGVTVSPVRLFARTGANSFNAYDPGSGNELNASLYNTNAPDQLCAVCHANTNNPGYGMTRNISGRHNAPGYGGNEAGKDCSGCHSHNQDGAVGTVDGLMPLSCNGCHSYPGLDNTGTNLKQMSAGHWKHVGQPLPAGNGTNNKGYECTLCHFSYTHNGSGYTAGQSWVSPTYYANVDIRFDNTWNPGTPTYAGANAYSQSAPGNGGTGACAGLYCHGGNASLNAGWAGSSTSPVWNGTVSCGACHDTGTADTTAGTRFATKNHPAHLDNAWGPGVSAFTSGGNCAEGTGCHTSYGLSPDNHPHANNAMNFRTTVADNTPAALSTTQICRNCHTTYTSGNIPTSGDDLARGQWDNTGYRLPCVTCHNGGSGTQAWQNLNGTGEKATNIEETYYGNGHGASGIDNASTTTDAAMVDQVPPVRCGTCHGAFNQHIGTEKDGTNPWRLNEVMTNYTETGGLDQYCLAQCHTTTPSTHPARHAWRVSGSGVAPAQTKDNTVHTHPTSQVLIPSGKDRWLQMPTGLELPVQADLLTKSPPARSAGSVLVCVTCHDPHGVGTAQTTTRTFWGANDNGYRMLRYRSGALTALCAKCHK